MTKTVSLETAKLLKEAGWPQDGGTVEHWYRPNGYLVDRFDYSGTSPNKDYTAAPDVSELLAALPGGKKGIVLFKAEDGYQVRYPDTDSPAFKNANPAEALAQLYLALKEQKLV